MILARVLTRSFNLRCGRWYDEARCCKYKLSAFHQLNANFRCKNVATMHSHTEGIDTAALRTVVTDIIKETFRRTKEAKLAQKRLDRMKTLQYSTISSLPHFLMHRQPLTVFIPPSLMHSPSLKHLPPSLSFLIRRLSAEHSFSILKHTALFLTLKAHL